MPVVGFINDGSADASARYAAAFRKGLNETGYVEGQNVTVEYHWLEGQYDRLPALMADLVRRQVAVIATIGSVAGCARGQSCNSDDPDRLRRRRGPGPAWSCRQPRPARRQRDRHQFFPGEVAAKRLRLLHDLVPKAVRVAVLLNPTNASSAETTLREVQEAAPAIGLQIQILNASDDRRDRCGLCHHCARAPRCPLCRSRRFLHQPRACNLPP